MQADFWKTRWKERKLGFHLNDVNPFLRAHIDLFQQPSNARVFLPLCGKTLDIGWLLQQGFSVVGAELSEIAVKELFEELDITPEISDWAGGACWQAPNLCLFQGDIFQLDKLTLGQVDWVFDRAALVAMPVEMRAEYSQKMIELAHVPQLLVTFEFDLSSGPPFNTDTQTVSELYADCYQLNQLSRKNLLSESPKFTQAGASYLFETAWQLLPHTY